MKSDESHTDLDRPSVLTPEAQKVIIDALAEGNYYSVACACAGTTCRTFRRWRQRWEQGDPIAVEKFGSFFTEVNRVLAVAELQAVAVVRSGAPGWQASAWFLERRFPKRWGRKVSVSVVRPPLDVGSMTDEELREIARGGRRAKRTVE